MARNQYKLFITPSPINAEHGSKNQLKNVKSLLKIKEKSKEYGASGQNNLTK